MLGISHTYLSYDIRRFFITAYEHKSKNMKEVIRALLSSVHCKVRFDENTGVVFALLLKRSVKEKYEA